MKLRSIALAGLLGSGLLMTSGCGTDDIEAAINSILNTSYITIANADATQEFIVEGSVSSDTTVNVNSTKFFGVINHDNYTVSTAGGGISHTFPKDGGYLFGLCSDGTQAVSDGSDTHRINVVNLDSAHAITSQTIEFGFDNGDANLSATISVGTCNKVAVPAFDNIDTGAVDAIRIDGKLITMPTFDSDLEDAIDALVGEAEFDLVVFDVTNNIGTAVPIVKPNL